MQKNPACAVFPLNQKVRPVKRLSSYTGLVEMTSDCLVHIRQGIVRESKTDTPPLFEVAIFCSVTL